MGKVISSSVISAIILIIICAASGSAKEGLTGRIIVVYDSSITISLGSALDGVSRGDVFCIVKGNVIIGKVEVEEVGDYCSKARILEQLSGFCPDMKVVSQGGASGSSTGADDAQDMVRSKVGVILKAAEDCESLKGNFGGLYGTDIGSADGLLVRDVLEITRDGKKLGEAVALKVDSKVSIICIKPGCTEHIAKGDKVRFVRRPAQRFSSQASANIARNLTEAYIKDNAARVEVIQQKQYVADTGYIRIVAEVGNIGRSTASGVKVTCNVYSFHSKFLGTSTRYIGTLGPGESVVVEFIPVVEYRGSDLNQQVEARFIIQY